MFKAIKNRKPARKELNLSMSPEVHEELQKLQMQTAAPHIRDVFRHALANYAYMVDLQSSGSTIIIRDKDGKEVDYPKVLGEKQ